MDPLVPFLVSVFLQQLFAPNPPIIISNDTTFITSPIAPDGRPDYERHLLDRYRQGIAPQQNAAVDIVPILGSSEYRGPEYALVCQELGIDFKAASNNALVPINDQANQERVLEWLQQNSHESTNVTDVDSIIEQSTRRAWSTSQVPPLALWLRDQSQSLDSLVSASVKNQFYLPSPSLLDDRRELLMDNSLPHITSLRNASRSLCARAMGNLGEGQTEKAWSDLLAVYRLARLSAQGRTSIEKLTGLAIQHVAHEPTLTLLASHQLSSTLARQIQQDLQALPDFSGMADCIDQSDRVIALEVVTSNSRDGLQVFRAIYGDERTDAWYEFVIDAICIDWNPSLIALNQWCDRLAECGRSSNGHARNTALTECAAELDTLAEECRWSVSIFRGWFDCELRSDWASDVMVVQLMRGLTTLVIAEDRRNAETELLRLAAALAVYRCDNGRYPATLRELVHAAIQEVPTDHFLGRRYRYQRVDDGYFLYSVGPNGIDDGGSHEQLEVFQGRGLPERDEAAAEKLRKKIPTGADDLSIRLPVPPFKLPPPPN